MPAPLAARIALACLGSQTVACAAHVERPEPAPGAMPEASSPERAGPAPDAPPPAVAPAAAAVARDAALPAPGRDAAGPPDAPASPRDASAPDAGAARDARAEVPPAGAAACGLATIVPRAAFDSLFPPRARHPLYSYEALAEAVAWSQIPRRLRGFAVTGDPNTCRREVAAFFAHVDHETGRLRNAEEHDKRPYCRPAADCPCDPNATDHDQMYYGRGPLQLSYNYHYCRAAPDLGADLHRNPGLLATDPVLTWKSALWFWMTRNGAGDMTPHAAMTSSTYGFGETIRSVNGGIDCGNPEKVKSRVDLYLRHLQVLGGTPEDASKLGC